MTRSEAAPPWSVRFARIGAAVLAGIAIVVWVTPVNVRSQSGFFGCGSPADPRGGGDLVDLVCKTDLDLARLTAVTVLAAAAVVLFLSEFVAPRMADRSWLTGTLAVAPLAVGLISVSVAWSIAEVGGTTSTGTPFRCGTPFRPATDEISALVCGQLAQTRLVLGVGGAILGLGLLAGGAYLTHHRSTGSTDSSFTGGAVERDPQEPQENTMPSTKTEERE